MKKIIVLLAALTMCTSPPVFAINKVINTTQGMVEYLDEPAVTGTSVAFQSIYHGDQSPNATRNVRVQVTDSSGTLYSRTGYRAYTVAGFNGYHNESHTHNYQLLNVTRKLR